MSGSVFKVTNAMAARRAVQPGVRGIATSIMQESSGRTPVDSGEMKAGWQIKPGRDPGTTLVVNRVRHAVYVEYGTRKMPAHPVFGPVLAEWRARVGTGRRR